MIEFPSTKAKDQWGLISDTAQREPVTITRHGRPSLVVTSVQDYQALLRLKYDDLKGGVCAAAEDIARGDARSLDTEDEKTAFLDKIKSRGRARLEQSAHEPS